MILDEPFATPGRASWLELPGNRRLFLNTPRLNWNLALPTSKVGRGPNPNIFRSSQGLTESHPTVDDFRVKTFHAHHATGNDVVFQAVSLD